MLKVYYLSNDKKLFAEITATREWKNGRYSQVINSSAGFFQFFQGSMCNAAVTT